jgi:hypothetical protein
MTTNPQGGAGAPSSVTLVPSAPRGVGGPLHPHPACPAGPWMLFEGEVA